jgi:glutamate carboxypeptidase
MISEWIDARREEMLAFLRRVVEMESPTDDKAAVDAVGRVFGEAYRALGWAVRTEPQERHGDHLVAEAPPTPGGRVLLVGHMDTVYPHGTATRRPFTLRDGRAYGPAVMDMKGGLVVMLFALRALHAAGRLGNVRVVLNSDEEPGSPTSRDGWAGRAADCDWAFVLEPAQPDGALVNRRKGVGIFRVSVTGRAAHAGADPEKGANAILALAHQALAVSALADASTGTTVNVGVVHGGTHPYVVPASAEAVIDIRIPTQAEARRVTAGLEAIAARVPVPDAVTTIEGFFHRPPLEEVPGTDPLKALVAACGREVGLAVRWAATGGASDGNNLAAAGVPTIDGMGPAGGGAHSDEEWMDVESFVQKATLLALVLHRLWEGAIPRRIAQDGARRA